MIPDDIKTLAVPILAHRVLGKSFLQAGEFGAAEAIIRDIVDRVRVPSLSRAGASDRSRSRWTNLDDRPRSQPSRGLAGRICAGPGPCAGARPRRTILTREGWFYFGVMAVLLVAGLLQQVNLDPPGRDPGRRPVLDLVDRQPGPLRRLSVIRRVPRLRLLRRPAGRRLHARERAAVDRRAGHVHGRHAGAGRSDGRGGSGDVAPGLLPPRAGRRPAPGCRWQGASPRRGKYRFRDLDLGTRAPFGLVERRVTIPLSDEICVYPKIGQLTRRWFQLQRQASENRLGKRHDRSCAAGGIPRPARLPARRQPAVDPLADLGPARRADGQGVRAGERAGPGHPDRPLAAPAPRSPPSQREAMEQAISFAATACLETCRRQGRRLLLGWTGAHRRGLPGPGVGQAPARAARAARRACARRPRGTSPS